MKLYCAWSSVLQNWDRRIINKIYYYSRTRQFPFVWLSNVEIVQANTDTPRLPSMPTQSRDAAMTDVVKARAKLNVSKLNKHTQ